MSVVNYFMCLRNAPIRKDSSSWGRRTEPELICRWGDFLELTQFVWFLVRGRTLDWFEVGGVLPHYSVHLFIIAIEIDLNMRWSWWLDMHVLQMVDVRKGQVVWSDLLVLKKYLVLNFIILRQKFFGFLPHCLPNNTNTHWKFLCFIDLWVLAHVSFERILLFVIYFSAGIVSRRIITLNPWGYIKVAEILMRNVQCLKWVYVVMWLLPKIFVNSQLFCGLIKIEVTLPELLSWWTSIRRSHFRKNLYCIVCTRISDRIRQFLGFHLCCLQSWVLILNQWFANIQRGARIAHDLSIAAYLTHLRMVPIIVVERNPAKKSADLSQLMILLLNAFVQGYFLEFCSLKLRL